MDSSGIKLWEATGGFHVNVCGQELKVTCETGTPSLQDLKETVQHGIGLQQDCFIFFDAHGCKLLTDKEVYAAIQAGRTPIYATLSGHTLHDFEQRQEEFAQMQWKVVRDQFTVLSLQLQDFQRQFKALRSDVESKDVDTQGKIEVLRTEVASALQDVADCKDSRITTEELVRVSSENLQNMSQNLGKEILNRDTAIQEIDFKIKRVWEAQANEITGLTEKMNEKHKDLLEVHELLGQDVDALRQTVKACQNLQISQHEEQVDRMSAMEERCADALSQATNDCMRVARQDASSQVEEVANQLAELEKQMGLNESLTSQKSEKNIIMMEQVKEQVNGMREAMEQCRLQNRVTNTLCKEAEKKQERSTKELMSELAEAKAEASRERRMQEEQARCTRKNIDANVKAALATLETRLLDRVDRESTARSHSMVQALDDIGAALEKDIPSTLRSEPLERISTNSVRSCATAPSSPPVVISTLTSGQDVGKVTLASSASSGAMVQLGAPLALVKQKQFVPNARPVPAALRPGLQISSWTQQVPTQTVQRGRTRSQPVSARFER